MALGQADLDNLERALASGQLSVQYDGKSVTYRSVAELTAAIAYTREQLALQTATGPVTQSYAAFARD